MWQQILLPRHMKGFSIIVGPIIIIIMMMIINVYIYTCINICVYMYMYVCALIDKTSEGLVDWSPNAAQSPDHTKCESIHVYC